MKFAIKIMNVVKSGALYIHIFSENEAFLFQTEARWLPKGNMLTRLFKVRELKSMFY